MQHYKPPAAMKSIGSLFDKYRTHFKPPQASVEKEAVAVINDITGFKLVESQVKYSVATKTLSLQLPSILRTEVLFKKQQILDQLQKNLGKDGSPQVLRWLYLVSVSSSGSFFLWG